MRILMIHPHDIHSSVEPWTRRIKCLAKELAGKGYKIKLAYFPLSFQDDLKPHFLDGYEAVPFSRHPSPLIFIQNSLGIIKLGRWADIIHFQKCHHYASLPAVLSAYLNKKPLHYDWDDWEEMIWYESCGRNLHSNFVGFFFRTLERFLPVLSDTVSVSSEYLKNFALSFGARKVFPVPVGADLEEFNPGIDGNKIKRTYNITGPLVLYVGQLHGAQYIDLFIEAASIVLNKNPNARFMIVGEGFMEDSLKSLAEALGIKDMIIFTGSVAQAKVREYICAADVCVAPFRDTKVTRCKSPLKIVEYLSCGKAIVAGNVGELRKMLGGAGVLVEPGNPYRLAEGILKLLADKALRERIGIFARKRAEGRYNWAASACSLISAYQTITEK